MIPCILLDEKYKWGMENGSLENKITSYLDVWTTNIFSLTVTQFDQYFINFDHVICYLFKRP